jgi:hypothetical protein
VQEREESKVANFTEFVSSIFREEEEAMQENQGQIQ